MRGWQPIWFVLMDIDMSLWQEHDIAAKVLAILQEVPEEAEGHHLGRPFLTAYQIAIEFAHRHPDAVAALGHPVGGKGVGAHYSLATYLANQLSRLIKGGHIDVEGGFLSNRHLQDVTFTYGEETITSSLTDTQFKLSMFRLREG